MKAEKTCELIQTLAGLEDFWSQEIIELAKQSDAELNELYELIEKYQSPETQRLIELGKAVEMWLANEQAHGQWEIGYLQRGIRTSTLSRVVTAPNELLEWYSEQDAK